ncbi:MAG: sulfurtransferase TusA family protein [Candidatus Nanopelagicales bacterium]
MTGPIEVDAVGLLCPQPVILLARTAADHPGAVLHLRADDPAAATDIPAWCRLRGAELLSVAEAGSVTTFAVRSPGHGDRTADSDSAAGNSSR